jgi:hypothetical protein
LNLLSSKPFVLGMPRKGRAFKIISLQLSTLGSFEGLARQLDTSNSSGHLPNRQLPTTNFRLLWKACQMVENLKFVRTPAKSSATDYQLQAALKGMPDSQEPQIRQASLLVRTLPIRPWRGWHLVLDSSGSKGSLQEEG